MTLKEFSLENEITSVQYADNIIFNVMCGQSPYGLDVDTSSVTSGTVLIETDSFIINDTDLIVGDIILNLYTTNML